MKSIYRAIGITICLTVIVFGSFALGKAFGSDTNLNAQAINAVLNTSTDIQYDGDFAAFWKVWQTLDEKFVGTKEMPTDQEKIWSAIEGLADAYDDPYTVFMPPEEAQQFREGISGNFEGIGAEISIKDDVLTVVAPLKNSPAEKAGILAGDKILEINGTSTVGMTVEGAIKIIRGKKGTSVVLDVMQPGSSVREVTIVRDVISVPAIETKLVTPTGAKAKKDNVFVIEFSSFNANSANLFREALREFIKLGTNKLIIDLRGNPGGYLSAAVDIASFFLPSGKVVITEDFGKDKEQKDYRSKGQNIFNDNLQLIVLVDKGSASASEILAGALKEHGEAKLIGENTFGKGSVQELVPIAGDASLKVTIARWLTPNGNSISEGGLKPDILVTSTSTGFTRNSMEDPYFLEALKAFK